LQDIDQRVWEAQVCGSVAAKPATAAVGMLFLPLQEGVWIDVAARVLPYHLLLFRAIGLNH
jgi:hypothetical protein